MKTKEQIQYNRKDDKIEVARTFDNQPSLDRAEDLRKAKVGLSGEIRPVNRIEQRIGEGIKIGFETIYYSQKSKTKTSNKNKNCIQINTMEQMVSSLFG